MVSKSGRESGNGRYSGGGKLSRKKENQWDPVKKACKYEGDLEPKCIKAYYDHLDRNNHLEWSIWLEEFMYSQFWIAISGAVATTEAPFLAFMMWIFHAKPHLADAPWSNVGAL